MNRRVVIGCDPPMTIDFSDPLIPSSVNLCLGDGKWGIAGEDGLPVLGHDYEMVNEWLRRVYKIPHWESAFYSVKPSRIADVLESCRPLNSSEFSYESLPDGNPIKMAMSMANRLRVGLGCGILTDEPRPCFMCSICGNVFPKNGEWTDRDAEIQYSKDHDGDCSRIDEAKVVCEGCYNALIAMGLIKSGGLDAT